MQVVDCESCAWFLLQEGNEYYLDVNCQRSAFGFSVTIQLTEEERWLYFGRGRAYIMDLANQVSDRSNALDPRNVTDKAIQERLHEAIMSYKKLREDG